MTEKILVHVIEGAESWVPIDAQEISTYQYMILNDIEYEDIHLKTTVANVNLGLFNKVIIVRKLLDCLQHRRGTILPRDIRRTYYFHFQE